MMYPTAVALKRGLLLFWAAWLTVVFTTNALDGLKALGLLAPAWPFAWGNYLFLAETTARYRSPGWLDGLLFLGVVAWEAVAAALFWRAGWRFRGREDPGVARVAFAFGLGLWAAFLLADELCIAYAVEGTHLRLFTSQLVTLLVLGLVPEDQPRTSAVIRDQAERPD